jgi:hypothetical protein
MSRTRASIAGSINRGGGVVVNWTKLHEVAPELAELADQRFASAEFVMLGTLRKDGWPRISPIEYTIFDGEFTMGGIWQAKKALDLLRDPRCAIHSATTNKNGQEGDVKLYGRAMPLAPEREEPYWQHVFESTGWRAKGPAHVFTFDVMSAGYVVFAESGTMRMLTWPGPQEWVVREET